MPAWYLPRGTIKAASEDHLEEASSSSERWGIWCAALVIVAVIAELIIAWMGPPYLLFLEESAVTDAAVAIGIVGEVGFGMWDSRIQTELRGRSNERLEKANERAAKLEKEAAELRNRAAELERLTKWREISPDAKERLITALKPWGSTIRVFLEYERGDMEAFSYAEEIWKIFAGAGAQLAGHAPNSWFEAYSGVAISASDAVAAPAILTALQDEITPSLVWGWNPIKMWPIPTTDPRPNVLVCVFPKPPPARFAETAEANETESASVKRE